MIVVFTMLALAVASHFRMSHGEGNKAMLHAAIVILGSGLVYALGYLFVGIADALRYLHWLYTAGLIGSILTVAALRVPVQRRTQADRQVRESQYRSEAISPGCEAPQTAAV
jgi:hypothetical protein